VGKTAEELRYDIERQREYISRDLDALGDKVSPSRMVERRTEAVKGRFRGFRESVMGSADHITTSASDHVGSMGQSAQGAVGSVTETVGHMPDMAKQQAAGNPLMAGAIAFGVGLLAATVIPETRKEHQLAQKVQPQLEQAAHMAAETGKQVAEEMKPVAQEHAGQLQETAKEAASNVTSTAKEGATTVQEEAKSQAQEVKPS
jgi:polyhydroxyalkanoate synthesis regulator phasin